MSSELRPLSDAKLSKKALVTLVRDDTQPAAAAAQCAQKSSEVDTNMHPQICTLKHSDECTHNLKYGCLEGVGLKACRWYPVSSSCLKIWGAIISDNTLHCLTKSFQFICVIHIPCTKCPPVNQAVFCSFLSEYGGKRWNRGGTAELICLKHKAGGALTFFSNVEALSAVLIIFMAG